MKVQIRFLPLLEAEGEEAEDEVAEAGVEVRGATVYRCFNVSSRMSRVQDNDS